MKAVTHGWFFAVCSLFLLCLGFSGCGTPRANSFRSDYQGTPSAWQEPYLLYLSPSPHARLHVEIVAVEGCAPSVASLDKLRKFLNWSCNKPEGIEIVQDRLIPRLAARGVSPEALARKYLNGPPQNETRPPAFMCILFYDERLSREPATNGTGGEPRSRKPSWVKHPRTTIFPYPIIYMNTRYAPKPLHDLMLLHETGHMLGLAHRTNGASGFHCRKGTCLMNRSLHISRLIFGLQKKLCHECAAELLDDAKRSATNLRFAGSVLVRSEAGYHILTLPDRVRLVVGELTDEDCRNFAAAVRSEKTSYANQFRVSWLVKEKALRPSSEISQLLKQIEIDNAYDPVAFAASHARGSSSGDQWYFAPRSDADFISRCREDILSNPQDDWSYNRLAWIQSTSPDTSLRNGKEAIDNARRACELSDWKNRDRIDTLAAAYAEAGDFQQAIDMEEQAMQTGGAAGPGQETMQNRINLYKQSRSFRERQ